VSASRPLVSRMAHDARTRTYVARRTIEGLSKKEIIRCLKRYISRELDGSIGRLRSDIDRLAGTVGDPEDVVDERGWLPRDRPEIMLVYYKLDRESKVKKLRVRIPELSATLEAATDRRAAGSAPACGRARW
jgi:hypothetical protein